MINYSRFWDAEKNSEQYHFIIVLLIECRQLHLDKIFQWKLNYFMQIYYFRVQNCNLLHINYQCKKEKK